MNSTRSPRYLTSFVPRGTFRGAVAISLVPLVHFPAGAAETPPDPYVHAYHLFETQLIAQSAGVFWIAGELIMLFAMQVARRYLTTQPLPSTLQLTPNERRRAVWMSLFLVAIVLATIARYLVWPPLHTQLPVGQYTASDLKTTVSVLYQQHLVLFLWLWGAYITIWVYLESAIVYQGVHAFLAMKRHLRGQSS